MLPTEEQIRAHAYHLWKMRDREDGHDVADWLAAEDNLIIALNYEVIDRYILDGERHCFGNAQHRRCRYCERSWPETSFRTVAHALPECIGNKALIAKDECDRCNGYFSQTLEDSFGKLFLPLRNMLAVPGKRGVPTYKSADNRVRIEFDPIGDGFQIKDHASDPAVRHDEKAKRLICELTAQPYIPVRVLKCLTKMALAIMPEEELTNFRHTVSWVLNADDADQMNHIRGAGCYIYFLPRFSHNPTATLMRRVTTDTPLPYMLFLVSACGMMLQTHVPLTPMNNRFAGQPMKIPRIGGIVLPGGRESQFGAVRLDSADWVNDTVLNVELTYHSLLESQK